MAMVPAMAISSVLINGDPCAPVPIQLAGVDPPAVEGSNRRVTCRARPAIFCSRRCRVAALFRLARVQSKARPGVSVMRSTFSCSRSILAMMSVGRRFSAHRDRHRRTAPPGVMDLDRKSPQRVGVSVPAPHTASRRLGGSARGCREWVPGRTTDTVSSGSVLAIGGISWPRVPASSNTREGTRVVAAELFAVRSVTEARSSRGSRLRRGRCGRWARHRR
jgi:hypothetical protein